MAAVKHDPDFVLAFVGSSSSVVPSLWSVPRIGSFFAREMFDDSSRDPGRASITGDTVSEYESDVAQPPGRGDHPTRNRRRAWLIVGILVILAIIVWVAVRATRKPAQPAAQAQRGGQPIQVVSAEARKGDIDVYYTGLGTVTPIYSVTVRSRVDGQLMRVLFKEGQLVRKGELLADIDDRPFRVQLTQAQGQLLKDEAALNNARLDLARYETLIKRNAVAQQVLATQQATVAQDEGAVKADQGLIENAKLNITYSHISAPITGRVGLRLVDPGNIVHASDQNGMMVITQVQPISVIFTIPEDQLRPVLQRVNAGQRLNVDALDRSMQTTVAHGSLTTVDNQIDPTTGTLKLRATFDNRDGALFPNGFVNARLLVERKSGVTLVPNSAIQRNQQNTFVYLVKPDRTVTIRNVNIGTTQGDDVEVASGLAPGDTVVTTGVDKLQEGSKVVPHNANSERGSNNERSTK